MAERNTSSSTAEVEPHDDPIFTRLQESYKKQKLQLLTHRRQQDERYLQHITVRSGELAPTLELISDETAQLFKDLEGLLMRTTVADRGLALLHNIRNSVNAEIRQARENIEASYVEDYRQAFQDLASHAQSSHAQSSHAQSSRATTHHPSANFSSSAVSVSEKNIEEVMFENSGDWGRESKKGTTCIEGGVASDTTTSAVHVRRELKDILSETTSLTAESLAVLLQCETVRIYLYDDLEALHCAARFPYHSRRADPMQSTRLEMMAVREIHHVVSQQHIAINGTGPDYTDLNHRELQQAKEEMKRSGLDEMINCLIFPLCSNEGTGKCFGIIHAVNKKCISCGEGEVSGFTEADEVLVSMVSRMLGAILARYPTSLFMRSSIGEEVRRRLFPGDPTVVSLTHHLPVVLTDVVNDAAETGNKALSKPTQVFIYRAPLSSVYETRVQRERRQKLGTVASNDSSLMAVEFNMRCMNDLWASGMEDNVVLHKQYRAVQKELNEAQLLLRNLLDGLATARSMKVIPSVAHYLQTLELYGRSNRTERLAAFVSDSLIAASWARDEMTATAADAVKGAVGGGDGETSSSPYLSPSECHALQRKHTLMNATTAVSLHVDGPDGIRAYSSDPAAKRDQARFIEEMRQQHARQTLSSATAGIMRKKLPLISSLKSSTQPLSPTSKSKRSDTRRNQRRPFQLL